jgi:hypothetical protein
MSSPVLSTRLGDCTGANATFGSVTVVPSAAWPVCWMLAKAARRRETAELGPARTLRGETARLELVVTALDEHAGVLKALPDGAVADALEVAETARAEAHAARRATHEAETRATLAEDRAVAAEARADRDDKVAAARRVAAEKQKNHRRRSIKTRLHDLTQDSPDTT